MSERRTTTDIYKELTTLQEKLNADEQQWTNVVGRNQDAPEIKHARSRIDRLRKKFKKRREQEILEISNARKLVPLLPSKTDQELQQLAFGIYSGNIFTDRHIDPSDVEHMLGMIFMPLAFSDPTTLPPNIGCIYEHVLAAGHMGINGFPTFTSMKMLNIEDANIVFQKVKQITQEYGIPKDL